MPDFGTFVEAIFEINSKSGWDLLWFIFTHGLWIIVYCALFFAIFELERHIKVHRYLHKFRWVFLAIDVPKENEQTPRAVENIFVHLAGAHSTRDLVEKFWDGEVQRWFSFEIVSIEGYVQFVVMTEAKHRDLLEALIYAQYPDAQMTEIEDYAKWAPEHYPDPEYKAWGVEWMLTEKFIYPFRTWEDFEDKVTGDYKDPMAAILEIFTRIGIGEQAWLQILVRPIGQKWKLEGVERVKQIEGREESHQSWFLKILTFPFTVFHSALQYVLTNQVPGAEEEKNNKLEYGALALRPSNIGEIKGITAKVERIGHHAKVRFVYIARHENFNKNRMHHNIVGAMKQFTNEDGNALKPDTKHVMTTAHYFMKDRRKDHKRGEVVKNFKNRDIWRGTPRFVLNVRELATLWHFPMPGVKVPTLKRAETRTSRPPVELPVESLFSFESTAAEEGKPQIPVPKHMMRRGVISHNVMYGEVELKGRYGAAKDGTKIMGPGDHGQGLASADQRKKGPPPNLPVA